jgi:hypothetical protein
MTTTQTNDFARSAERVRAVLSHPATTARAAQHALYYLNAAEKAERTATIHDQGYNAIKAADNSARGVTRALVEQGRGRQARLQRDRYLALALAALPEPPQAVTPGKSRKRA